MGASTTFEQPEPEPNERANELGREAISLAKVMIEAGAVMEDGIKAIDRYRAAVRSHVPDDDTPAPIAA